MTPEEPRGHHPDCPALYFIDHPERCRCIFMSMLDEAGSKDERP